MPLNNLTQTIIFNTKALVLVLLLLSFLFFQNLKLQTEAAEAEIVIDAATSASFPESQISRMTATGLGKFSHADFEGAVNEFSNALKLAPKRGSLYLQRGLALLELERYAESLSDLNKALELDKSNKLHILVCRGRALMGLSDYKAALDDLNQALTLDNKFVLAYICRADAYLALDEYENAYKDIDEAIRLDPSQSKAYLLRAKYYRHKNQSELALNDFNKAVALDSSYLEKTHRGISQKEKELRDQFVSTLKLGKRKELAADLIQRGLILDRAGEYLQAIKEFSDAITDAPDSLEAYKWRASVYLHMSSFENAIIDLSKAIDISPEDPSLYAFRAKAYLDIGESQKAIEDYNKAVKLSCDPPASLYEARGLAYSRIGNSDMALADFTKSIELDPANSTAYADRGLEYLIKMQYENAIKDFDNSIEKNLDLTVSYKFRAQAKQSLGDLKGALQDLEKAQNIYKSEKDLFGYKQIERNIALLKKENQYSIKSQQK